MLLCVKMPAPKINDLSDSNPIDFTGYEEHFGDVSMKEEPAGEEYGGVPGIKVEPYFEDGVTLGEAAWVKEEVERSRDPRDAEVIFLDGPAPKDSALKCPKDPCDGEVIFLDGADSKDSALKWTEDPCDGEVIFLDGADSKDSALKCSQDPCDGVVIFLNGADSKDSALKCSEDPRDGEAIFLDGADSKDSALKWTKDPCDGQVIFLGGADSKESERHTGEPERPPKESHNSRKCSPHGTNQTGSVSKATFTVKKIYCCSVCNFECPSASSFSLHIGKHSPTEIQRKRLSRKTKPRESVSNKKRKRPQRKPPKRFVCEICGYDCLTAHYLGVHIEKHSPEVEKSSKAQHELSREKVAEKPFVCHICTVRFKSPYYLTQHIKRQHTTQFYCSSCDFRSVSEIKLNAHIKTCCEYVCGTCNYVCRTSEDWEKHKTKHIVICRECGADMKSLVNLRWHVEVAHNLGADAQTKRHLCNFCDFECAKNDEMRQHMTKHTKEKVYDCLLCDYKHPRLALLQAHIRREHVFLTSAAKVMQPR